MNKNSKGQYAFNITFKDKDGINTSETIIDYTMRDALVTFNENYPNTFVTGCVILENYKFDLV